MNAAPAIPASAGHTDPRFRAGNVIVSYRFIGTIAVVDQTSKKIVTEDDGLPQSDSTIHICPHGLPGDRTHSGIR